MQILRNIYTAYIKVIPRAKKIEFIGYMDHGPLKTRLRAVPEDGKVNMELVRFLEQEKEEK